MNRLKNSIVYLSGAMDLVPDNGTQWRNLIKPFLLDLNIRPIDPCDKPEPLFGEKEDKNEYKELKTKYREDKDYDNLCKLMKKVRNTDLRFVDLCDFLIVNIDINVHACGTYNEVSIAVQQKKPIIIRCEQGKHNVPFWLFGCIPHETMFSTWDEVREYIRYIDSDENPKTLNRWSMFNI
jgi:hypothetical protein